jgi:sn-glycerol 3-phosphate transport system permease protein
MVERTTLFSRVFPHIVLCLGVFILAFPVYLAVIASTHTAGDIVSGKFGLLPGGKGFENYTRILFTGSERTTREPVATMMLNSLIMAVTIACGKILIAIITAFALVYFKFPFRKSAFWLIFLTLMLPVEVRIYPTYKVVTDLGLLDTYTGLTMPLIASATGTLLFRQFFMTVPDELLEASKIDGAGAWKFFWDTLVPLSATTCAALFVIQFIYGWNQYLWPLLITSKDNPDRMATRHGNSGARHVAAGGSGRADAALVRQRSRRHREVTACHVITVVGIARTAP